MAVFSPHPSAPTSDGLFSTGNAGFSTFTRVAMGLTGVLFLLIGGVLFLVPHWSADHFPWKITPFVAMTMGGWYLGSVAAVWQAIRLPRALSFASRAFLWAFSLGEALLLVVYHDVVHTGAILGFPYIFMLGVASIAAVSSLVDRLRTSRPPADVGAPPPALLRGATLTFVVYVSFLSVVLLGGVAKGGSVWAKPLTPLTAHAFGVFYGALVVGALPLLWTRGISPFLSYIRAGLVMVVVITLAAVLQFDAFDFHRRPAALIYFGSYLAVGVGAGLYLWTRRAKS